MTADLDPFQPDRLLAEPALAPAWRAHIATHWPQMVNAQRNADLPRWQAAVAALPAAAPSRVLLGSNTVIIGHAIDLDDTQRATLEPALRELHPWRKGPFDFFGMLIDTEWRSDWKWQRVSPHLSPLAGRRVLDVGCGSGYHLWRMRGDGASFVLGVEPALLFLAQFAAAKRYLPDEPVHLLPAKLEDLPPGEESFDTVFSMGVLYHRRDPLQHLAELRAALRPGGELVLETLVVERGESLDPGERYAQMRNVFTLPGLPLLEDWLRTAGFVDIRIVDVNVTSLQEQRATDWMRFQSLTDFLDPADASRTVEGHPAPVRAIAIARKPLSVGGAIAPLPHTDSAPRPHYIAPRCDQALRIVHIDTELLIVDKPAFLYTVPGRGPENADSVISRLLPAYPDAVIIHRLDLDTSGLLMVPLTARARSELSRQIRERTLGKGYEAVVWGLVEHDHGEIDSPLAPDPDRWPRSKIDPSGKSALTRFRVISRDAEKNCTKLRLDPVTGRQHQLRLHLASIGHPILGCDLYAHETALAASPRLLLHACELVFVHPGSSETVRFNSPAPF